MHGDLIQATRTQTWKAFKENEIQFLIASDVAARGLDSEGLDVVINYDVPNSSDDYVHRIGRTGRAGKEGRSYTLCMTTDKKTLLEIEKIIKLPLNFVVLSEQKKKPALLKKQTKPIEDVAVTEAVVEEKPKKHPLPKLTSEFTSPKVHTKTRTKAPVKTQSENPEPVNPLPAKIHNTKLPRPNKDGHIILIEDEHVNKKGFGDVIPSFMKTVW